MCTNLFDWLVRVIAIASFILYLWELWKRTNQGKLMLGFLHGAKSLVEVMSKRDISTGADWQPLLKQIDDMLGRLQPPEKKPPGRLIVTFTRCSGAPRNRLQNAV